MNNNNNTPNKKSLRKITKDCSKELLNCFKDAMVGFCDNIYSMSDKMVTTVTEAYYQWKNEEKDEQLFTLKSELESHRQEITLLSNRIKLIYLGAKKFHFKYLDMLKNTLLPNLPSEKQSLFNTPIEIMRKETELPNDCELFMSQTVGETLQTMLNEILSFEKECEECQKYFSDYQLYSKKNCNKKNNGYDEINEGLIENSEAATAFDNYINSKEQLMEKYTQWKKSLETKYQTVANQLVDNYSHYLYWSNNRCLPLMQNTQLVPNQIPTNTNEKKGDKTGTTENQQINLYNPNTSVETTSNTNDINLYF